MTVTGFYDESLNVNPNVSQREWIQIMMQDTDASDGGDDDDDDDDDDDEDDENDDVWRCNWWEHLPR